jgi:secreted PhoX family phosphatase
MNAGMDRRAFLRSLGALAMCGVVPRVFLREALADPAVGGPGPYGPLLAPDANGIMLPAGFVSRELARGGATVPGTGYTWHVAADGGATFKVKGGWVYVSNSERDAPNGGVSALRFDRDGNVVDAYAICTGTSRNCAGGPTPWHTWLTCEEVGAGNVWECDPTGVLPAERRAALGTFSHEAVAFDKKRRAYLTEDQANGRLYRFTPFDRRSVATGTLEVAAVTNGVVEWLPVPNPNPVIGVDTPTRLQVPASTAFAGGEGITHRRGHVYFTTKFDNRVWDYDTRRQTLAVIYDASLDPSTQLTGVDNITVGRSGDLLVAEDGGNMELVMITPDDIAAPLLRVVGQDGSELAGPAFDPKGRRLYVSSQRGNGGGITYEITGPFRRRPQ